MNVAFVTLLHECCHDAMAVCRAHRGLPVGFLLLGYSVLFTVTLSPCYILIHMFKEMIH